MPLTRLNLSVTTHHYKYLSLWVFSSFFLCFPVAPRVVDKNNGSIDRKQTSQSYLATRHWNAGDRCPSLIIKGPWPWPLMWSSLLTVVLIRRYRFVTLRRLALDDFSFVRVDRLKFCWIIPSGVDLQWPGFRIPFVSRIQDSWSWIPDSKALDSGVQKRPIHGFRIRIPFHRVTLFWPHGSHNCDDIMSHLCFNLWFKY